MRNISKDGPFVSNKITTTKYNKVNFLPLTFLIQLGKFANCFYIVNAILQSIPSISTNDPLATVVPLIYVFILGMVKEMVADYKRYQNDLKVNHYPCQMADGKPAVTMDLKVGDVITIKDDQIIPADCVLLKTNSGQECFIKTQSLDGETNLKPKLPIKSLEKADFSKINVWTIQPDKDLYEFKGKINYEDKSYDLDLK